MGSYSGHEPPGSQQLNQICKNLYFVVQNAKQDKLVTTGTGGLKESEYIKTVLDNQLQARESCWPRTRRRKPPSRPSTSPARRSLTPKGRSTKYRPTSTS